MERSLEAKIDRIFTELERGPVSYLVNGKKKWTMTIITSVLGLVVAQAIIGVSYVVMKAPTTEWVDNRINERLLNAPITRSADIRLNEANYRINSNEASVKVMQGDVKEIKNQMSEIKVLLGVSIKQLELLMEKGKNTNP